MRRSVAKAVQLGLVMTFLCTMALAPVAVAASPAEHGPHGKGPKKPPPSSRSGIDHVVVVMMENRSFDHLLGWHPTADAQQAGLTYSDRDGASFSTYPLAPDFTGCGHSDPDHSWEGARVQYNDGAMDGFLRSGASDIFAIGYYVEEDRPFFNALARNYTTCDRFFAAILGPTYPNRIFQHAAQTDRIDNTLDLSTLPTIWDRLSEHDVKARYYVSDISFLLLWGAKYLPITRSYDDFLADAAAGKLPAVSFVEPRFAGDELGISGSDHPLGDIRVGDAFLADTFRAVASSPDWPSTVFIVTYDEWGGFFEHVAPPRAVAPNNVDPDIVDGEVLLGMRVPVVVASPFSRGDANNPRVISEVFDHTSVLKLIEWRWNLPPLTARDASDDVANLLVALDLNKRDTAVPSLPDPEAPVVLPCLESAVDGDLPLSAIESLPVFSQFVEKVFRAH